MLVTYIRSSSYGNWDMCQQQYFMTYVLGHMSDSGKKAELGTIVHKTMEVLSGLKKFQQDNPTRKTLHITDDVVKTVKVHIDKFHTDEFIVELAELSFASYTEKSKHKWARADEKANINLVWKTLLYNEGQFDPRLRDVVDPEPHFDIPIEEEWAKYEYKMPDGEIIKGQLAIKGTIDLVTNVGDGIIEVIDWKTGMRKDWATGEVKTYEKLCSDPQLLLYNYAISKIYPDFKQSIMTIFFVKDGGPFSMCFDESDQKRFLGMLKKRFEQIKYSKEPKLLSRDQSSWKCTRLCHFQKNNWPGTDKSMCKYVNDHMKEHGMEKTVAACTREDFSVNFYEAPG